MSPEEIVEEIKKLSLENSSTQKMLSEIRTMLSQFIADQKQTNRSCLNSSKTIKRGVGRRVGNNGTSTCS